MKQNYGNVFEVCYTYLIMKVRSANVTDVKAIHGLINCFAERDLMLFRSMADIFTNLQTFLVVEEDGETIGCCALEVIWSDLAEIKSLAVLETHQRKGTGAMLINAAVEQARKLGVPKVFGLTLKPQFFDKLGFHVVNKDSLPMKVWSDCARCTKQQQCDETAVVKLIEGSCCPIRQ
jgi:amino-acid N-acetyltransferase